ncbi:hypothetical protein [Chromobacterium violaceum]|uniref:hypothetical protein n=1 Tax=Chromobacterium violaceum TaxID=536 RepID=UPI0005D2E310|nr:hypothetical protein [Chromobacterium violaceum]KJH67932.1 hypothetical protein UF16_08405 [Chromobacterium violaceum]
MPGAAPSQDSAGASAPAGHRIALEIHPLWVDTQTRASCQYAPIIVGKGQGRNLAALDGHIEKFEGKDMTRDGLMNVLVQRQWLAARPSPGSYNADACVVERIILRLHKP